MKKLKLSSCCKLPYHIIIDLLEFYEICFDGNILNLYGKFKKDVTEKMFLIFKNVYFGYINDFDVNRNIMNFLADKQYCLPELSSITINNIQFEEKKFKMNNLKRLNFYNEDLIMIQNYEYPKLEKMELHITNVNFMTIDSVLIELNKFLEKLTKLKSLGISIINFSTTFNSIDISKLKNLETLKFFNKITVRNLGINENKIILKKLKTLQINLFDPENLKQDCFENLERLYLHYSSLNELKITFENLKVLKVLCTTGFRELTFVNFSYNFPNLKSLYLSNVKINKLIDVPDLELLILLNVQFENLNLLENIIEKNKIKKIKYLLLRVVYNDSNKEYTLLHKKWIIKNY